jgi:hypothetical protein
MGSNQSRPSDSAVNEKLIERLQALHMKDERPMNEKDGYVVVGGEARMLCCIQGFVWKSNCSKHLGTLLASSINKMYLLR